MSSCGKGIPEPCRRWPGTGPNVLWIDAIPDPAPGPKPVRELIVIRSTSQSVSPTKLTPVVGHGIVPVTDLMHISVGGKTGPGRDAYGTVGIRAGETTRR